VLGNGIKFTADYLWEMNTISAEFLRGYVLVNAIIESAKKKEENFEGDYINDI
jgi:hypothetical protein